MSGHIDCRDPKRVFRTPWTRRFTTACGTAHLAAYIAAFIATTAGATEVSPTFGTYERPFSARSPWNSRPIAPVLGADSVPKSEFFPAIDEGKWSTGVFLAKPTDPPVTVKGEPGKTGVWNVDAEEQRDITIPHWPADLTPANGSDGHADIVDPQLGVVHSFWALRKAGGQWIAAQYAWSRLAGSGWGDPSHYFQGARAAGVPTSGGVIRKHEVNDGKPSYQHVLALSLTFNGMASEPLYVFPATSADSDAATTNRGRIPEGGLVMLAPSFDTQKLATPALRKIAETLKTYGAYVVDRNHGTPYVIYAEIGAGIDLHKGGWNNSAASDLDTIREGLHPVESADGWVDGDGKRYQRTTNANRLSMRGPWKIQSGDAKVVFEDWSQAAVFSGGTKITMALNDTGRGLHPVLWAMPEPGATYRLKAFATGDAHLRITFREQGTGKLILDTGELGNAAEKNFIWPANAQPLVYAISGPGAQSTVRGELLMLRDADARPAR